MADLHRPLLGAWLSLLSGCGAPISNQVFLEEAAFQGALPSEERLRPPDLIWGAPNGDSLLLAAAKQASSDWAALMTVAVVSGDGLRRVDPDEITSVVRRWDAANVAARVTDTRLGFQTETPNWWVQATITQVDEKAFDWSMGLSLDRDGPYTEVGTGTYDGVQDGAFIWDLPATVSALALQTTEAVGVVSVTFSEDEIEGVPERVAAGEHDLGPGAIVSYDLTGETALAFQSSLAITMDLATWPAGVAVVHREEGGRAEGIVTRGVEVLPFTSCWDASGNTVWQSGTEVSPIGSEANCPLADPF